MLNNPIFIGHIFYLGITLIKSYLYLFLHVHIDSLGILVNLWIVISTSGQLLVSTSGRSNFNMSALPLLQPKTTPSDHSDLEYA